MSRKRKRKSKPRIRHGRIDVVEGRPIVGAQTKQILQNYGLRPDSMFSGEIMECLICGRIEKSDPLIESNWRAMVADGKKYYFCRDEFPADAIATKELFNLAYERCLAAVLCTRAGKPLDDEIFRPVNWNP